MSKDEALRLALEALERYSGVDQRACDAENAIRTAIEKAEKQAPYLFYVHTREESPFSTGGRYIEFFEWYSPDEIPTGVEILSMFPVYTTPPQRTWVGLTDEEYKELHLQMGAVYFYQDYGRAIEARLKDKNT